MTHRSPRRARDLVEQRLGRRPGGPVRALANPRYLGVGFNPVSFFFLYGEDGGSVESVIAEVTNTPWRERTAYVIDGPGAVAGRSRPFEKAMHVSPFQPMDQRYEISASVPGDHLRLAITTIEQGREVFNATMALRRRELTPLRTAALLFRYPPMTMTTLARIYANAVRLKLKGARFHPHPRTAEG